MTYCIYCGVKVHDRHKKCPLCREELIFTEEKKEEAPLYPLKPAFSPLRIRVRKVRNHLVLNSSLLALTVPLLTLTALDFISGYNLSWSLITSASLLFLWGVYTISVRKIKPLWKTLLLTSLVLLFLLALDIILPAATWFVRYALPGFFFLGILTLTPLILTRKKKSPLKSISSALPGLALFLLLFNWYLSGRLSWSLIPLSVLLPGAFYLWYLSEKQ